MRAEPGNSVRVANAATDEQFRSRLKTVGGILALMGVAVGAVIWAYTSFATAAQVDRVTAAEDKRALDADKEVDEAKAQIKEMQKAHDGFRVQIVRLETDSGWIKVALEAMAKKQRLDVPPPPVHPAPTAEKESSP